MEPQETRVRITDVESPWFGDHGTVIGLVIINGEENWRIQLGSGVELFFRATDCEVITDDDY